MKEAKPYKLCIIYIASQGGPVFVFFFEQVEMFLSCVRSTSVLLANPTEEEQVQRQ